MTLFKFNKYIFQIKYRLYRVNDFLDIEYEINKIYDLEGIFKNDYLIS